jgi:type III pantothenate kinase
MNLLIDAGNTRIKWAWADDDLLDSGVLPLEQAGELPALFKKPQGIQQIWVSNVAGEKVAQQISRIECRQLHFVVAQAMQCGVRNGYAQAGQLGSDRWAALIAAWHIVRGTCLVVNSGTATTIDALSAQGEFIGGVILPGVELMQRSLVAATDQLQMAPGKYTPLPLNTSDALYSGAIQSNCGAIERQYALLNDHNAPIILGGGAAELLQKHIQLPMHIKDSLVLRGLLLIALEANKK